MSRRLPPPWSVEETGACFIVRDANGQALAFDHAQDRSPRVLEQRLFVRTVRQQHLEISGIADRAGEVELCQIVE